MTPLQTALGQSGVRPKATQGVDAYAEVTADQIAARAIGQDTTLPSLELASEDPSALFGSCDVDYGCIYLNTLSWATPETPLPMETNPRKVFERLFGQGGSPAERAARFRQDRSNDGRLILKSNLRPIGVSCAYTKQP